MWNLGDWVTFVKEGILDSKYPYFIMGRKYKIVGKIPNNAGSAAHYVDRDHAVYEVLNEDGRRWLIEPKSFSIYKKEVVTEVDWLNAVQENFKEGC